MLLHQPGFLDRFFVIPAAARNIGYTRREFSRGFQFFTKAASRHPPLDWERNDRGRRLRNIRSHCRRSSRFVLHKCVEAILSEIKRRVRNKRAKCLHYVQFRRCILAQQNYDPLKQSGLQKGTQTRPLGSSNAISCDSSRKIVTFKRKIGQPMALPPYQAPQRTLTGIQNAYYRSVACAGWRRAAKPLGFHPRLFQQRETQ